MGQGGRETGFVRRMFTDSYRLYDLFGCPVGSLAVLAGGSRGWRPDRFGFSSTIDYGRTS